MTILILLAFSARKTNSQGDLITCNNRDRGQNSGWLAALNEPHIVDTSFVVVGYSVFGFLSPLRFISCRSTLLDLDSGDLLRGEMRFDILEGPVFSLRQEEVEEEPPKNAHHSIQVDYAWHSQCIFEIQVRLCRSEHHQVAQSSHNSRRRRPGPEERTKVS